MSEGSKPQRLFGLFALGWLLLNVPLLTLWRSRFVLMSATGGASLAGAVSSSVASRVASIPGPQ